MRICIWTGPAWEPWGPPSLENGGIGGSETAAVHMASNLVKLGHEVVTFGEHDGFEGTHDGVEYVHFRKALENRRLLDSDIWISSRDKRAIRLDPHARLKILWVHDINCGDDLEREILKYDKIFCLSRWAMESFSSYYPQYKTQLPSKIWLTRNGIDPLRYGRSAYGHQATLRQATLRKSKAKFFYSSSPDRGLDVLLGMWPKIRKMRDDAELHVYYGFETWKKMAENAHATASSLRIAWFVEKLQAMRDIGVTYHGRVGQAELAATQLDSILWAYPTNFKETSCITAMEAQAAGAVPITTRLAALAETVRHGLFVEPPRETMRYETEFLGLVRGLLGPSAELRNMLADDGRRWALENCSWENVAKEWDTLFQEILT